ncbi:MAG: carboxypeptidase regulatory-like domain-containing protein [Phycisphaerales bacterium]|nr:MAG: carboxypeptidase regulatory-like domain-containing protein [Phycisphaerales bacterium]
MIQRNKIKFFVLLSISFAWLAPTRVSAMISFSKGNRPVENRSWPTGTEEVANLTSRVVSVSGPRGGESYFGYRCNDTAEFNAALEKFSAIQAPRATRRSISMDGNADIIDDKPLLLVVHDYRQDVEMLAGWTFLKERLDWMFAVWAAEDFYRNFNRPQVGPFSDHPYYRQSFPPPRIDVYVGGDGPIVWEQVIVPSNVRVIDKRAAAAPVDVKSGGVILGRLFDMATHHVIAGADVVLMKRIKPRDLKETARTKSDETGAFSMQAIDEGYYVIHVEAEGYAGRDVGPYDNRSGHSFQDFDVLLIRTGSLRGQVVDTHGNPARGVRVYAQQVWGIDGFGYKCSREQTATTDETGRFELLSLPRGYASLRCRAPSLHQKSISSELFSVGTKPWEKPEEARIVVEGTGTVRGKVVGDDGNPPRRTFMVQIEPKEGATVGTWGGVIQCKEGGVFEFKGVPPGEYVVIAKPNPMREGEASEPKAVTVTIGGTVSLEIISHYAHNRRSR